MVSIMLILIPLLTACAGARGWPGPDSSPEACDTAKVSFNDCSGQIGDRLSARLLVDQAVTQQIVSLERFTIIRTEVDLDAFWQSSGLAGIGEPMPAVDFAAEEVAAFGSDDLSCHSGKSVNGFYASPSDPASWIADVEVTCVFASCDTTGSPALSVWALPIGDIGTCERGEECQGCP